MVYVLNCCSFAITQVQPILHLFPYQYNHYGLKAHTVNFLVVQLTLHTSINIAKLSHLHQECNITTFLSAAITIMNVFLQTKVLIHALRVTQEEICMEIVVQMELIMCHVMQGIAIQLSLQYCCYYSHERFQIFICPVM